MPVKHRFSLGKKRLIQALAVLSLISVVSPAYAVDEPVDLPAPLNYDLVVYGGTPAGVMAAIAAKRQGLNVALLAQGKTVGGTISNGLGATDVKDTKLVTAIPREFFSAVQASYKNKNAWRVTSRRAEEIFIMMLNTAKVDIFLNSQVTEATVTDNKITCLKVTDDQYCAAEFIDASYMGELLPLTNTASNLGRQDLFAYDDFKASNLQIGTRITLPRVLTDVEQESLNSLPFMQHPATFDPSLIKVSSGMPSFTYRLCITKGEKSRPFQIYPEDEKYIPAWRLIAQAFYSKGCSECENRSAHKITKFWRTALVQGNKWDLNSFNSFTNFPMPENYLTDPSARAGYNLQAAHYIESLYAYLQGPNSPVAIEQRTSEGFGICNDEFTDNNNIPYEPYIREGRRITGQSTLLVSDELTGAIKEDSVGLAKYPLDNKLSINIQYKNKLYRDYATFMNSKVYELPYSITVPKTGPDNLLVPVAVSTSPLAYGSLRMEPHFMALGQATGIAAALAFKNTVPVKDVSISSLQEILAGLGQRLHVAKK